MARQTEWRRTRTITLSRGYQTVPLVELAPGETVARSVVDLTCYTGVQAQGEGLSYPIAYSLYVTDGDETELTLLRFPWSNYELMEDAVWWGGMTAVPYLYTTAVSPPQEIAMYRPTVGVVDTPVMRTNNTGSVQTLWLLTESSDYQNYAHQATVFASILVKLS